jgi:hypothetical protein
MSLFLGLNEDVVVPDDQPKIVAVRALDRQIDQV